ncbi:MAG: IS21 family transposase [Bacteroidales bacterium]|nr:IS21 family transposase [Bacteroidales bacterium]
MANRTIQMEVVKQIQKLNELGYSKKTIARELGLSRNTVKSYLTKGDASLTKAQSQRKEVLFEFFPYCNQELGRKGVTRQILWGEYRAKYKEGYSYTQFCEYLGQYLQNTRATLHIEQQPGDKMYIDFSGSKLQVVDRDTGEISQTEVFVSVLGFSGLTFVRACYSQQKEDFLNCIVHALEYYRGVPKVLVPDNLKAGVDKANRYEADINRDLLDLGNHYGMAVLPSRSHKPRDKAWVERMVQIVYTRIFAPLRNQVFTSIEDLNEAIIELLDEHNELPFQRREESRRELFETQEKKHLQALPTQRYELKEYLQVKVMKNSHIQLHKDRHYYSVPYQYIGQKVKVVYTATYVSVYLGGDRIAYHLRNTKPHKYTTIKEHLPSSHQFVSDWSPDKFINWAAQLHPDVESYICKVLENKSYPEQTYRSCVGILSFAKKAGKDRLIAACQRAASFGAYNYKVIEQIINNKLDRIQSFELSTTMPKHENIRGSRYYT